MRVAVLIPAYQAEPSIAPIVAELVQIWPDRNAVLVVDDGSTDDTACAARAAGAEVVQHAENRGKGAALRTGMSAALAMGFDAAVVVDADGQHPPREALRLRSCCPDPAALVLGVRDMARAGAPRANRWSNRLSNYAVSGFAWHILRDTQCGLRRYPLRITLSLGAQDDGFAFEAEVILRAVAAAVPIVQIPIQVIYPPEEERVTHFDVFRDPTRIVFRVLGTSARTRGTWLRSRLGRR